MARTISTAALGKLAQTHGVEPVLMVDVTWLIGGVAIRYATKDVVAFSDASQTNITIPGKVQEIGAIDSVVAISLNETSEEFSLVLDDSDNTIKDIIDFNDIMLRDVSVYQWFEGLNFEDRFLIFQGKINSPISWSETDRTVKFSVVSQLEDKDVGFSPEEGTFPDLPDDMIGKLWPECFGTTLHEKAIQVDFKHRGTLADPLGLHDFTLPATIQAHAIIGNFLTSLGVLFALAAGFAGLLGLEQQQESLQDKANGFFAQAGQKTQLILELQQTLSDQKDTEVDSVRILGGEHFPRGTLKLDINGAICTGSFAGPQGEQGSNIFNMSCQDHPERQNFHINTTPCGNPGCTSGQCKEFPSAEGFSITQISGQTSFIPTGNILGEQAGVFFAQGGSSVTIASNEPLRYFVSITPGTVIKVAAFTTFESGERVLVDVPSNLFTVSVQSFGSVNVTVVTVNNALSKLTPSWEDTIYVTFESSVGPNPIDIMSYLINKYAGIPTDADSFAACREALINYPMHFCLTRKKNIVTVLKELAFMARLAISIKNGAFFCRYLPAQPPSVFEFTEDTVLTQSIELQFTDTEELVTKYVGTWRAHGAQEEDNRVIIRYNVKKYGTHEENVDMYAFNYVSAIVKTLTFWINRRGHTWKKLKFDAALDALNVETFDGVTLNFDGDYAANESVLGCVEEGNYNPDSNTMEFLVWTGVRSGDMTQFDLAYPQNVSVLLKFPDPIAEAAGFAGGDGPGNSAAGDINRKGNQVNVNVTFEKDDPYSDGTRKKQDKGSNKPSDTDDENPGRPVAFGGENVNFGGGPPETPPVTQTNIQDSGEVFLIDIRSTEIADSDNPGQVATFDTFFKEITDSKLKARTDATWKSDANEAEFDFKFDSAGSKFGAGTAFLQDD